MKKKFCFGIVMFIMCLSIIGCGEKKPKSDEELTKEIEAILESTSANSTIEIKEVNEESENNKLDKKTRMEVLSYINGILDPLLETDMTDEQLEAKADEVWKDAEEKFGITENDIWDIMSDSELTKEYYSNLANESNVEISSYDATLNSNGYGNIAVAESKDVLDQYIDAVSNNDDSTIGNLLVNEQLAVVEEDVKVNIEDLGIATTKVIILEGIYKNFTGYVISEQVNMN